MLAHKYSVIVVDPPWPIKKIRRRVRPNQIEMDYSMIGLNEISNLPVFSLAEEDAICFLWAIDKYLFSARDILENWGFNYHCTMAWNKTNGISLYGFNRRTEFILVGFCGKHSAYPNRKTIPTAFTAKSMKHSEKPQEFYELLSHLPGDKIDLFARKKRVGWDVWGNEVESDIEFIC